MPASAFTRIPAAARGGVAARTPGAGLGQLSPAAMRAGPGRGAAVLGFLLALAPAALLTAANDGPDKPPAPPPTPPEFEHAIVVPPKAKPAAPEISAADQKAELEFLTEVETTINKGDGTFLHAHFDYDGLLQKAVAEIPAAPADRDAFTDHVRDTLNVARRFAVDVSDRGARLRLLHVRTVDGRRRAIFRLDTEYHRAYFDFVLGKNKFGEMTVVDLFDFDQNCLDSAELGHRFRLTLARQDPKLMARLSDEDKLLAAHLPEITHIEERVDAGDLIEAARQLKTLPEDVRQTRLCRLYRIDLDFLSNFFDLAAAIEEFAKAYPDDPVTKVLQIDRGLFKKDYDMVLAGVDAEEKWIGPDSEIDLFRGLAWLYQQKYDQAYDCAMKAVEHQKDHRTAYVILVAIATHNKAYEDALIWLDSCKAACGDALDKEIAWPIYDDLRNSEEYKHWLATRAKDPAPAATPATPAPPGP